MISEDSDNIAAGEKQLITIARAMVANPPMMILDEATSNVDTRTEELVQKAMDKLTEGRTSFIIAHRLSTVKNADKICVIKGGECIAADKHDNLLNTCPEYKKFWDASVSASLWKIKEAGVYV